MQSRVSIVRHPRVLDLHSLQRWVDLGKVFAHGLQQLFSVSNLHLGIVKLILSFSLVLAFYQRSMGIQSVLRIPGGTSCIHAHREGLQYPGSLSHSDRVFHYKNKLQRLQSRTIRRRTHIASITDAVGQFNLILRIAGHATTIKGCYHVIHGHCLFLAVQPRTLHVERLLVIDSKEPVVHLLFAIVDIWQDGETCYQRIIRLKHLRMELQSYGVCSSLVHVFCRDWLKIAILAVIQSSHLAFLQVVVLPLLIKK